MITDELREWWVRKFPVMDKELHKDFTAIADRIDAEHERVRAESIIDMTDERMAEHGWVRLPVDASGMPIRVGDEVEEVDCDSHGKVFELRLCENEWWVIVKGICRRPHKYRHYKPTVEDVLREFGDWYAHTKGGCDEDGIIAEYAAKLQLRGEGERRKEES